MDEFFLSMSSRETEHSEMMNGVSKSSTVLGLRGERDEKYPEKRSHTSSRWKASAEPYLGSKALKTFD